jgi:hypothetical protein
MRCFVHREVEAVGTCRACNKGLCSECVVDSGHSISCKGSCESKANTLNLQVANSTTVFQTHRRNRFVGPLFLIAMGAAFMVYAGDGPSLLNIGTVMGGGFIVFGVGLAILNQRYARELQSKA